MHTAAIRQKLVDQKVQLQNRDLAIRRDVGRGRSADLQDFATDSENDLVLYGLDASARAEIAQIDAALLRLDAGAFGRCVHCGDRIDERRLDALPSTELCRACAG